MLVSGWAGRSPSMRMPPLIVYRLNSSTMNGTILGQHGVGEHRSGRARRSVHSGSARWRDAPANGRRLPAHERTGNRAASARPVRRPRRTCAGCVPTSGRYAAPAERRRSPRVTRQTAGSSRAAAIGAIPPGPTAARLPPDRRPRCHVMRDERPRSRVAAARPPNSPRKPPSAPRWRPAAACGNWLAGRAYSMT